MENDHVLSGLMRKRAELAGKLNEAQNRVRRLIIDLDNIDASILIFNPGAELEAIKPMRLPPKNQAYKGQVTRIVLETLRTLGKPMTAPELAQHVMAERGVDTSDKRTVKTMGKRVAACLRHWRNRKVVRSRPGPERFQVWEMVR